MTERKDPWETATWEGSRREQLRRSLQLTLRERIQAIEDMQEVSDALARCKAEGRFQGFRQASQSSAARETAPPAAANAVSEPGSGCDADTGAHSVSKQDNNGDEDAKADQ